MTNNLLNAYETYVGSVSPEEFVAPHGTLTAAMKSLENEYPDDDLSDVEAYLERYQEINNTVL
jgi:hypothetical protein